MTHFVIAGMPTCVMFNHVRLIADELSKRLPNFKAQFITLKDHKWKEWLEKKNRENGWYHLESPIIWKELTMKAGTPHLIGGASEFWEYCYDYYNLEYLLENEELYKLVADSKQYEDNKKECDKILPAEEEFLICVSSNGRQGDTLPILIQELIDTAHLFHPQQVIISLIKEDGINEEDIEELSMFQAKFKLVHTLQAGLQNADLFILVGDYTREENEDLFTWLHRNKMAMEYVAYIINGSSVKKSLHVILGMNGPCCFNAAILIENVSHIHAYNIVAETSSAGLEALSLVSNVIKMPIEDLHGPPVWGFIGLNQLIDLEHIVQRYDVYRPNVRAVKNNYESTLELGTTHTEYRYLNYLGDKLKNVWIRFKKKKQLSGKYTNKNAKIRGIVNIINNWYFPQYTGNIISLGIQSNGSFGIPSGIVFSQPVMYKLFRWVPVQIYTVPRKDPCGIEDLFPFVIEIYKYFKLKDISFNEPVLE